MFLYLYVRQCESQKGTRQTVRTPAGIKECSLQGKCLGAEHGSWEAGANKHPTFLMDECLHPGSHTRQPTSQTKKKCRHDDRTAFGATGLEGVGWWLITTYDNQRLQSHLFQFTHKMWLSNSPEVFSAHFFTAQMPSTAHERVVIMDSNRVREISHLFAQIRCSPTSD